MMEPTRYLEMKTNRDFKYHDRSHVSRKKDKNYISKHQKTRKETIAANRRRFRCRVKMRLLIIRRCEDNNLLDITANEENFEIEQEVTTAETDIKE